MSCGVIGIPASQAVDDGLLGGWDSCVTILCTAHITPLYLDHSRIHCSEVPPAWRILCLLSVGGSGVHLLPPVWSGKHQLPPAWRVEMELSALGSHVVYPSGVIPWEFGMLLVRGRLVITIRAIQFWVEGVSFLPRNVVASMVVLVNMGAFEKLETALLPDGARCLLL